MPAKLFSIVPGFRGNIFTPQELEATLGVVKEYNVEAIQFTPAQRLGLVGPNKDELAEIGNRLADLYKPTAHPVTANGITYIQSCPGQDACKYGIRDAQAMGRRIENIELPRPLTTKVKVGVAGCHMCCTEPYVRDLGIIAERKGWKLTFGGNGAGKPRLGDVIADNLTDDQVVELARRCLIIFQNNGSPKMRTARFMEVYGTAKLKQEVLARVY